MNTAVDPSPGTRYSATSPGFTPFLPAAVVFYRCADWQGDPANVPFEHWQGVYYVEPLDQPNHFEWM